MLASSVSCHAKWSVVSLPWRIFKLVGQFIIQIAGQGAQKPCPSLWNQAPTGNHSLSLFFPYLALISVCNDVCLCLIVVCLSYKNVSPRRAGTRVFLTEPAISKCSGKTSVSGWREEQPWRRETGVGEGPGGHLEEEAWVGRMQPSFFDSRQVKSSPCICQDVARTSPPLHSLPLPLVCGWILVREHSSLPYSFSVIFNLSWVTDLYAYLIKSINPPPPE